MNNILGAVLAIVATVLLLFLREIFVSVGKKNRSSCSARDQRPSMPGPDVQREQGLRPNPIREFAEPIPLATPIAVDEFLAELRAKAQEQTPSSRTTNRSTTDLGQAQSKPTAMAGDPW